MELNATAALVCSPVARVRDLRFFSGWRFVGWILDNRGALQDLPANKRRRCRGACQVLQSRAATRSVCGLGNAALIGVLAAIKRVCERLDSKGCRERCSVARGAPGSFTFDCICRTHPYWSGGLRRVDGPRSVSQFSHKERRESFTAVLCALSMAMGASAPSSQGCMKLYLAFLL